MSSRYGVRWSVLASLLVLFVLQACSSQEVAPDALEPVVRVFADDGNIAPSVVRFDATDSTSSAGAIVSYRWTVDGVDQDEGGPILDVYIAHAGPHTVTLTIEDIEGNTGTVSEEIVIDPAPSPYTIDVRFFDDEGMTLTERRAFSAAARRWAEVIQSDFEPFTVNKGANECGAGEPAFSGSVDDIVIFASIAGIDGRDGILAQAGPCALDGSSFPLYGIMQFDEVDLPQLADNADLEGVVLHEMGHVLGFGTIWEQDPHSLIDPEGCFGAEDPRFVGTNAVREWQGYGGTGLVPVQEGAAPDGTACGHWRETTASEDLFNELMTGFLDASMDLSRFTIGSFADLGYAVDYTAADDFDLFPALTAQRTEDAEPLRDLIVLPTREIPVVR